MFLDISYIVFVHRCVLGVFEEVENSLCGVYVRQPVCLSACLSVCELLSAIKPFARFCEIPGHSCLFASSCQETFVL